MPLLNARSVIFELSCDINRVRTGHGKPEKSWNLSISVSRPGKSWNMIVGHGKSWEIVICVVRKLLQVPKQVQNKIQANYVTIPENKDDFDNFLNWQLNLRSWETRKSRGI